jgi:hypothetical protein
MVEVEAGSRRRETAQLAAATSVVKGRSESTRNFDLLFDFVDEPGGVEISSARPRGGEFGTTQTFIKHNERREEGDEGVMLVKERSESSSWRSKGGMKTRLCKVV